MQRHGACHAVGVAGALRQVTQRSGTFGKGMEALVSSVKERFGRYAPGGLCNCCDDDYKALITYMSTPQ